MRHIKFLFRPRRLLGIVMLLLISAGLAALARGWWNAQRGSQHFAQGRQALEQGDVDQALAEFSEAIRLDPGSVEARRERARLLLLRDRWEDGIVDLDAALRDAPGDAELHVLRAETYAALGRNHDRPEYLERAIADADEALRLGPGQALAWCHRALAYSAKFDDAKALADANEAVRQRPNDPSVFFTRGRVLADRGADAKALADFSEAIRLDPKHARAFAARGVCHFELHDDLKALADCNHAVELAPRDGRVYQSRARVYYRDRCFTKELADLDRALELNSRDLHSYFQRAVCHLQRRDVRRACADCSSALAINPDNSLALVVRSLCHLQRGRRKRAQADMERALQLRPEHPYVRLLSAGFYQIEDQPDKALAEYNLVLKGSNEFIARRAFVGRALSFLQKGDIHSAIADCDQALKLASRSIEGYALRSVACSQAGDADQSRSDFDVALALDRKKAHLFRSEFLDALKLDSEAIADLTELIKLSPGESGPYQARAAAYLGPMLQPAAMGLGADANSLIITKVLPDMPAGKAGILVGDKIVRVGSFQPTQFHQVVDHVSTFRAGTFLELEIERNGERLIIRMPLAARPIDFTKPNQSVAKARVDLALGDCQKAIALNPTDPANHRLLATAHDLLDQHEEAIKSATEASRLDPEDPLAHLSRARSYLALKQDDKAIADASDALRLEAEGGVPYALRGLAYAGQNKAENAKADLAVAAKLDPKLKELKEAVDRQFVVGPPLPFPIIPDFTIRPFKSFEKPASEPLRWPNGGAIAAVLGIMAAVFLVALAAGYHKAKAR
jgi:tetratricopeptide (TPR) repeat protein